MLRNSTHLLFLYKTTASEEFVTAKGERMGPTGSLGSISDW